MLVSHVRMTLELLVATYNLNRVVDFFVRSEFSLDIHVAKYAFFDTQSLSMGPQDSPVKLDGWEQCCGSLSESSRCACICRRS